MKLLFHNVLLITRLMSLYVNHVKKLYRWEKNQRLIFRLIFIVLHKSVYIYIYIEETRNIEGFFHKLLKSLPTFYLNRF